MGRFEQPRRIVQTGSDLSVGGAPQRQAATSGALSRERVKARSQGLRDAVARLDAGLGEQACRELAEWIREEYTTAHGTVPVGFLARCFLGPPYVDHQLNLFAVIVRHFAPSDAVPKPYSDARMLVRTGGYAYVEVYSDGLLIPVLDDGTAVRSGDVLL
ncbi:hypothetical protein ABZV77_06175 [Streptomyces sp. NPDC004732]|uniref:hypothetical protein n=1 Tax=Streptomyces sp. NPDC004732 TaxID=3154290 RepID=UPI00339E48C2